ncbi:MAG: hypothetical protein ACP5K9_00475 [Candidatus Micrarchaeia archaeon]
MPAEKQMKQTVALDFDDTFANTTSRIGSIRDSVISTAIKNISYNFAEMLHIGKHRIERVVLEKGTKLEFNSEILALVREGKYDFYISTMNGETEAINNLLSEEGIPLRAVKSNDIIKSSAPILVDNNITTVLSRHRRGMPTVLWVNDFNSLFAPLLRRIGIPTASNKEELSNALDKIARG